MRLSHPDPIRGLTAGVDEDSRCRRCVYGTPRIPIEREAAAAELFLYELL